MTEIPAIYVARHGQTEWNLAGRLQGALDSPLTPKGVLQAKSLNQIIRQNKLAGLPVFCSPQPRARATAELALSGLSNRVHHNPRLVEIDLGIWCGMTSEAVAKGIGRPLQPFEIYHLSPGETLPEVADRAAAFLAEMTTPAIVITHGVTSRILRCLAMGQAWENFAEIPGGQGQIHVVQNRVHSSLNCA